jgi:hypothetical protein
MKQIILFAIVMMSTAVFAQPDEDQVKAVIESAYIGGIHNGGPVADIRAGFHPSFIMFVANNNEVKQMPIEEWITNIEKNRATRIRRCLRIICCSTNSMRGGGLLVRRSSGIRNTLCGSCI